MKNCELRIFIQFIDIILLFSINEIYRELTEKSVRYNIDFGENIKMWRADRSLCEKGDQKHVNNNYS